MIVINGLNQNRKYQSIHIINEYYLFIIISFILYIILIQSEKQLSIFKISN